MIRGRPGAGGEEPRRKEEGGFPEPERADSRVARPPGYAWSGSKDEAAAAEEEQQEDIPGHEVVLQNVVTFANRQSPGMR